MQCFIDCLKKRNIELVETLENLDNSIETALGLLRVRGSLEVSSSDDESGRTVYLLNDQKRANLDFYRNSLINYLWPESLLATAILKNSPGETEVSSAVRKDFVFLKDLLGKELTYDPLIGDDEVLDDTLSLFQEKGLLKHSDSMNGDQTGRQALQYLRGLLSDLLWVYYLVLVTSETLESTSISQKDFAKKMAKTSHEYFSESGTRPKPTLGSVPISNALARFAEMGILEYKQGRKQLTSVMDIGQRDKVKDLLAGFLGWRP